MLTYLPFFIKYRLKMLKIVSYILIVPHTKNIKKYDVPFCCKSLLQSPLRYFRWNRGGHLDANGLIFLADLFFMFGLEPIDAGNMYLAALKEDPMRNLTFI